MVATEHPAASAPAGLEFGALGRARRTVVAALVVGVAALGLALLVPLFGDGARARSVAWVRALDLNRLTVAPAGTAARDPAAVHPGVPLRQVPGVPTPR